MKKILLKVCAFLGVICFLFFAYFNISGGFNTKRENEEKILLNTSYDIVIEDEMKNCLNQSSLIVRGTVIEKVGSEMIPIISEEEFNKLYEEEKIYYQDIITKYNFEISEIIKGDCEKEIIVYNVPGGTNGNYEQTFTDKEIYTLPEIGDEYILFLKKDKNGGYSTYSMIQGRIEVVKTGDTEGSDSAKVQTEDPLFSDCSDIDDVKFSIQNELNNESKEEE